MGWCELETWESSLTAPTYVFHLRDLSMQPYKSLSLCHLLSLSTTLLWSKAHRCSPTIVLPITWTTTLPPSLCTPLALASLNLSWLLSPTNCSTLAYALPFSWSLPFPLYLLISCSSFRSWISITGSGIPSLNSPTRSQCSSFKFSQFQGPPLCRISHSSHSTSSSGILSLMPVPLADCEF